MKCLELLKILYTDVVRSESNTLGRTGRAGKKGKVITFYSSESNIPDDLRTLISNLV